MLTSMLLRQHVARLAATVERGGLTRRVPLARLAAIHPVAMPVRALATRVNTAPGTGSTATTKRTSTTAKKPTKTTRTTAKKPAVKKAAPKRPKKAPKEKLKAWQVRDADGKLVPLPSESKPKRPGTAFSHFFESRAKELKNDPAMRKDGSSDKVDVTKIGKAVGAEWNNLSEADKKPFHASVERSKAEYESKFKSWLDSLTPEDIRRQNAYLREQKRKGKPTMARLTDPDRPKQPMTAFFLFLKDFRQNEGAGMSPVETAREGGAKWKSMSVQDKSPYESKAEANKTEYHREMQQYKSANA